jgi:hypothetical protein
MAHRGSPHRALDLKPPEASTPSSLHAGSQPQGLQVRRNDLLGGLIHEYQLAVA